jgi:hypothetical protein
LSDERAVRTRPRERPVTPTLTKPADIADYVSLVAIGSSSLRSPEQPEGVEIKEEAGAA